MASLLLSPTEDAFISQAAPDTNFGDSFTLLIGRFTTPGDIYRSLLKFDLSTIPPGYTINYAALRLFIYRKDTSGPQPASIERTLSNFNENTVTFSNAPSGVATGIVTTITDVDLNQFISIEITSLVQGWHNGSIPNTGLEIIGDESTYSLIGFFSKDFNNSDLWPELEIAFSDNCRSITVSTVQQFYAALSEPFFTEIILVPNGTVYDISGLPAIDRTIPAVIESYPPGVQVNFNPAQSLSNITLGDYVTLPNNTVYNVTQGTLYATIQAAINAANPGDTILATAGTYPENITIDRRITLEGAGSNIGETFINPAAGLGISIAAGGDNVSDRLIISSLRVTAGTNGIQTTGTAAPSHFTLLNVASVNNPSNGFNVNPDPSNPNMNDVVILNSDLSGNGTAGLRVASYMTVDSLTISNSTLNGNTYGLYVAAQGTTDFNNINITNSTFNNNTSKGMYFEALNNAIFQNIVVDQSGTSGPFPAGIDINLKQGNYQNVQLINATVTACGLSDATTGAGAAIKGRDDAGNNGTLNNVGIIGGTYAGSPVAIRFGEIGVTNATPTNASVVGAVVANSVIGIENLTLATVAQENNVFFGNGTDLVGNFS